jgi:hypothetical protein
MPALPDPDPSKLTPDALHGKLVDRQVQLDVEDLKASLAETKAEEDHRRTSEQGASESEEAIDKADLDKELELRGAYHQKIAEVAAGATERGRDSAKYVQTAAAALMGAYVALLGIVFSVTGEPLPLRGVYSSFFLALSIALAIAYLAYITRGDKSAAYEPGPTLAETQIKRTAAFVKWANAGAAKRRSALRASVAAFAFGVAFIPAAFIGPAVETVTATPPSPPAIPSDVPDAIAEDATRLFREQVDAYFAALEPSPLSATALTSCTGWLDIRKTCGWATEIDVERSFRRLAIVGLALVILIPLLTAAFERWRPGV